MPPSTRESAPGQALRPSWLACVLPSLLVFGTALACYGPALASGIVWDDAAHITRPDLRSLSGLVRIWTDLRATQQYYPVVHSAFWIEHRLWGDSPMGYHLLNVLLHATACCLFAAALMRLWSGVPQAVPRSAGCAWLAALLFAVHPVCVESVAWISEQKNTLSLVFYLLSALAYLGWDERRGESGRRPIGRYILASGLFLLALGTKSVTATLPAALLVILWWKRGRLMFRRDVSPLLPWFLVAVASGLLTAWVERSVVGAHGSDFRLTDVERLLLAGRAVEFYLGKLLWPTHLLFIYPRWDVPAASHGWIGCLVGAAAITLALGVLARRSRGPLACWLFFIGTLFPALGFFDVYPFLYSYVADHFQYQASLGIFAFAAASVGFAVGRVPGKARTFIWAPCGLLVAFLGTASHRQCRTFRDAETLYLATLEGNPDCWMAHNNLANLLSVDPSRADEALVHYREVVRLRPGSAQAHDNLALALAKGAGTASDAVREYEEALRIEPRSFEAHANLAALLTATGHPAEAVAHYLAALLLAPADRNAQSALTDPLEGASGPGLFDVHYNLGRLLATSQAEPSEALEQYSEALKLRPTSADAHENLGLLLARIPGRREEALQHYAAALQARPDDPEAYNDRGSLYFAMGRPADAISDYEAALRLRPDGADAHYNLANVLLSEPGHRDDALRHYKEALRIRPNFAEAHNNLGFLYAQTPGGDASAISELEEAVRIQPDYVDAHRNLAVLYVRTGQPEKANKERELLRTLAPALDGNR